MEALFLLTIYPVGAFLVGVAFAIATFYRRKPVTGVAATLWFVYGVYELLMRARILCTGECNIRVDLLLIYPLLFLATVAGIISAIRGGRAGR